MNVIGYAFDGDIYCGPCLGRDGVDYNDPNDERISAYFEAMESDYPLHCGSCHEFLGGSLTRHGFEWLRELWLERRWRNFDLVHQYQEHYDGHDWFFIPSPWGWMDPFGNIKD